MTTKKKGYPVASYRELQIKFFTENYASFVKKIEEWMIGNTKAFKTGSGTTHQISAVSGTDLLLKTKNTKEKFDAICSLIYDVKEMRWVLTAV